MDIALQTVVDYRGFLIITCLIVYAIWCGKTMLLAHKKGYSLTTSNFEGKAFVAQIMAEKGVTGVLYLFSLPVVCFLLTLLPLYLQLFVL